MVQIEVEVIDDYEKGVHSKENVNSVKDDLNVWIH